MVVKMYVDEVRSRKNITIRDLAQLSGVAKSHIERIEAGAVNPSVEVMCKLGRALGVPICDLFHCEYDTRRKS